MIFPSASSRSRGLGKLAISTAAGLLGASIAFQGATAGDGPFAGLAGVWSGNGTVTYASGTKERLRCRVQYVQGNEDNLQQALRCASDSYKFQINAVFEHNSGQVTGRWDELTMEVSGTITGVASSGHIEGSLHGPGFLAGVLVNTKGDQQTVTISSQDRDIRQVAILVRKSGQ